MQHKVNCDESSVPTRKNQSIGSTNSSPAKELEVH